MESARPARPEDLGEVVALARQARSELAGERGAELFVGHDLPPVGQALTGRSVFVGCIDACVVGYAVVSTEGLRDGRHLGVIHELYVEPGARAVGVGEALMGQVVAHCRHAGCLGIDAVALPGMRETKNFYETFGLVARAIVVHRAL
ncbi:MAG: N-acetyltransferase family protein [Acidimicrobiales bacterium]